MNFWLLAVGMSCAISRKNLVMGCRLQLQLYCIAHRRNMSVVYAQHVISSSYVIQHSSETCFRCGTAAPEVQSQPRAQYEEGKTGLCADCGKSSSHCSRLRKNKCTCRDKMLFECGTHLGTKENLYDTLTSSCWRNTIYVQYMWKRFTESKSLQRYFT